MPTPLPARSIFDGTANPTTSAMKGALGALRDYLAEKIGAAAGGPEVSSINGGPLAGHRNRVINGAFLENQRGVSGTVTLAAGQYGHDRWKAGAGGCTYTFSTVGNVTTITIAAGTLMQVVPGRWLQAGDHVLGWLGTALGRINGGAYGSTGLVQSLPAGVNATLEFSGGTLTQVQLEPGSTASKFEFRMNELALCRLFYRKHSGPPQYGWQAHASDNFRNWYYTFAEPFLLGTPEVTLGSGSAAIVQASPDGFRAYFDAGNTTVAHIVTDWVAEREL